jgi:steroid delta-isomerase-like uncharacterized protein
MDATLAPLAQIHHYFQAWNDRDPDAVVGSLVEGGTYVDPNLPDPVSGERLAAYADDLFSAFPDLRFEVRDRQTQRDGLTVVRWLLRGTNTGRLRGLPPSGRQVALLGVDVIATAEGGVRWVEGYFDRQTMAEQLGLQVILQPWAAGPFRFGNAVQAAGADRTRPGAVSLTWVDVRSDAEAEEVRAYSRPLAAALTKVPGFLSWMGINIGNRLMTITAWESEEAARQVMRQSLHREAVKRFFTEDFGAALHTGVWSAPRLNALWLRCPACAAVVDAAITGTCTCGEVLPEPPRWW